MSAADLPDLFARALELDEPRRRRFVAELAERDSHLALELERLLAVATDGATPSPPEPSPWKRLGNDDEPEEAESPATIGPYRVLSELGRGGMGRVYLAEQTGEGFVRKVALKIVAGTAATAEAERRFRSERRILAALEHPGIARFYDAGRAADGSWYIALEYVEGEDLLTHVQRAGLGLAARLQLFLGVLEAVDFAHRHLVVHRDLKPGNILVGADGRPRLLDFGISKLLDPDGDEEDPVTRTERRAFTPAYASPEQRRGERVTIASDVYSLGVLLYELLAGRRPFAKARGPAAELVDPASEREAEPPSTMVRRTATARAGEETETTIAIPWRELAGDLDAITLKALRPDPNFRYGSAAALADDLRRFLEGQPVAARRGGRRYRLGKFVRRHRLGIGAAAAIGIALATGLGVALVQRARATAERDHARLEAEKAARVSELLASLLTASDPFARRDREPTVRDVLDAGAKRVETELAGQPALQAEMLTVMGRTYQRLGDLDTAEQLLDRAIRAIRSTGEESPSLAQTLNDLGALQSARGNYGAAEATLREALDMRRRLLGAQSAPVAETLVELGRVYHDQNRLDVAEPLLREAFDIRRKALGEEHPETAVSRGDLALLLRRKGDLAASEELFRENLMLTRKVQGDKHPDTATALSNLALVMADQGRHAEAVPMYRESLEISLASLGPKHPSRAMKLGNLATSLRELGRLDESAAAWEESLEIARSALGEENPNVAMVRLGLARVRVGQGRAAEAEALARLARGVFERTFGPGDWRTAVAKSQLAESLTAQRRYADAEPLLLEARDVLKDVPGPQGREAATARARLAALYQAWGRPRPDN